MARNVTVQGKKGQSGGVPALLKRLFSRNVKSEIPSKEERLERARARRAAKLETETEPSATSVEPRIQKKIRVVEQLWGEGFSSPYNQVLTDAMAQPLNLEKGQELLEIGAGLGGCANYLSEKLGVRITALEKNKDFISHLNSLRPLRPPGHPVEFEPFDPNTTEFLARAFNAALVKDTLFAIADKEKFLKRLKETVKTSAHLAIFDFVLRDKGIESEAIDVWKAQEPTEPYVLSVGEQLWNFRASGFQPVTQKDITDLYLARIKEALPQVRSVFAQLIATRPIDKELALAILDEISVWLGRSAALESGDLRVYYFHAVTKELSRKMS